VHLLLSKQEGFGISTVEAMACGVPVVATNVPGSRDILAGTDAGHLVPYGTPEMAAKAIALFLDSPEKQSFAGEAARRLAVQKYAKQNWTQLLRSFYQKTQLLE
jgi:glycosyltransferase involved in cell wall biosynthesis